MSDCIEGSQDNRHDFSIVPVEVTANTTLVFKICRYCGVSYRYVDQIWEEIATEESDG
jgi:hypothetical protein